MHCDLHRDQAPHLRGRLCPLVGRCQIEQPGEPRHAPGVGRELRQHLGPRHWGWEVAQADTGLPISVTSSQSVTCDWRFEVSSSGTVTQNGAYDLWVHDISNPDWGDEPTDEIMIWLYRSNNAGPISNAGSPVNAVNLAGTTWTLHRGQISGGWAVWSYVRNASVTAATLNIMDFVGDLVSRGYAQSDKYLSSIEAGTEVFVGQGQFDTTSFGCVIQ